jgi:TonB-linked SusC/RagA family outer membrane protein
MYEILPFSKRGTKSPALHKFLMVMKLIIFIMTTAILQVSANTFAQKITLNTTNAPLDKVLNEIRNQSGYDFFYDLSLLKKTNPVTINVKNASLDEVLKKCFNNQPLDYKIEDKAVMIKEKEPSILDNVKNKIKAELAQVTITGKVQDETGQPLPGVTVKIKNTTTGTQTDVKGAYTLTAPDDKAIISFSFIGYETQELSAKDIPNGSVITLRATSTNLREVVVNKGPYSVKQELNTGATTHISGVDIARQPVSDPIIGLEGRVPGLYVSQPSGMPGSNPIVRLRGQNSIQNGNDPLYIIDGVPFTSASLTNNTGSGGGALGSGSLPGAGISPFNSLDPSNIENVEILKDADATAIYGSRGANGVILITTKRGRPGKTNVDISMTQGVGRVASTIELLNNRQYLAMRQQAYKNDGLTVPSILTSPTNTNYDVNGVWDTTRYTNWQKVFIGGTARYINVQGSVSGGNANTQFLIGGGYNRQTTVFPGMYSDQKASVHFNLTHISTDQKFHAIFSAGYVSDNDVLPQTDFTGNILLAPDAPPLYNPDGSLNWAVSPTGASTWTNPIAATLKSATAKTDNLMGDLNLSYEILPGLQLRSTFGYTRMQLNQTNLQVAAAFFGPPVATNRRNLFATTNNDIWIIEPQINYAKKIGRGKLDVLIGMTQQQNKYNSISFTSLGFTSDALINNPAFATNYAISGNTVSEYHYAAIYGRINYNWEDKYLLNLTARRDGSSRFGPDNEFGNFGAIGAGWIFSKEDWAKDISWLSFGKLRSSYGITGNDQIGDYQFLSLYSGYNNSTYQGVNTLYPTAIANPHFGWEVNKKLEGGLETGFLHDRIFLSADYYLNRSGNQLVGLILPSTAGFTSITANLPAVVQNTGLEFALSTTNIKSRSFTWTSSLNLTIPRNKLISFPGLASNPNYHNTYQEGKSLYIKPTYIFTGVNPQTGLYTFKDVNGDGMLDSRDQQFVKQVAQNYYGGLENSFMYKGWQLSFLFQFVKQTGFNYLYSFKTPGSNNNNEPISVLTAWQKPGDNSTVQKFSTTGAASTAYQNLQQSDSEITDASFIRLKNLELSYQLPADWVQKLHMRNLQIYVQGQNLLTITSYKGLDPETQFTNLPPLRMIATGLKIGL